MAANITPRSDLSLEDLLLKTLLELVQSNDNPELETFLLYLKGQYPQIPQSALANPTRPAIVQLLLQHDRDNAISATLSILRKMGKNQLAKELSQASGVQG